MGQEREELTSYCRRCGGDRHRSVLAKETRGWSADDSPVFGGDTWSIIECGGCRTVTFAHDRWFSEDNEFTDDGPPTPIVHRDIYPPSPSRKMPEWADELSMHLPFEQNWITELHRDIYAAVGMKAHALAAMGTRAIVDFVITSHAGESGRFKDKLSRVL